MVLDFRIISEQCILPVVFPTPTLKKIEDLYRFKNKIEELTDIYGGILFRDFPIDSNEHFELVAKNFAPVLDDYIYRSTPRTKLEGKVYTSTEYPKDRHIPMHNEFSYFSKWPKKILFHCVSEPSSGGETPIADCRKVFKRISNNIVKKFEAHNVMYARNYIKGIDLDWQVVFQTDNRSEVEKYCKENDIIFEWNSNNSELSTKQTCQSTTIHPVTKEKVWFNQAHLFHISSLKKEHQEALIEMLGIKNLTRNSFYGNGEEMSLSYLNEVREAYEKEKMMFSWKKGDILMLDNVLMAHGREPYEGPRKIVVAMGS